MTTARTRHVFAIGALAAAVLMGGCSSAATRTPTARRTLAATKVPAPMTPASGGVAHIIDYSANSDGPKSTVIVTGAIGDFGTAMSVYPNGAIDPGHASELRLGLAHGSFRLAIGSLSKKIAGAFRHWNANASTCSGNVSVQAATPIVPGSGAGSYRGISGKFTMTVTIGEVDVKPVCDGTSAFLAQVIVIAGSGTVSFGSPAAAGPVTGGQSSRSSRESP